MVGKEVGFLTVMLETSKRDNRGYILWECKCSCGKVILVPSGMLRAGHKKSCGCKSKSETSGTHGLYGTPTHNTWRTMIERCTKEYSKSYEKYKDVEIDPKWMTFEGFYSDMGIRPKGMTLDRINGKLGYCKSNCRWATLSIQQQNKPPSERNVNGYPGIQAQRNKFCARIRYNGNRFHLGTFSTAEEAHQAYDLKGRELFGVEWKSYFDYKEDSRSDEHW